MSDQQSELLRSFPAFIKAAEEGATIPGVDEHDLKALHDLCVERGKRFCGQCARFMKIRVTRGRWSEPEGALWPHLRDASPQDRISTPVSL